MLHPTMKFLPHITLTALLLANSACSLDDPDTLSPDDVESRISAETGEIPAPEGSSEGLSIADITASPNLIAQIDGTAASGATERIDVRPVCPRLDRGALIQIVWPHAPDETLVVWSINEAFIAEAEAQLAGLAPKRIPMFGLVDHLGCDPQYSWAPHPVSGFADRSIELCDGLPSHIEADRDYWLETVGSFCPWGAEVAVVHRLTP